MEFQETVNFIIDWLFEPFLFCIINYYSFCDLIKLYYIILYLWLYLFVIVKVNIASALVGTGQDWFMGGWGVLDGYSI